MWRFLAQKAISAAPHPWTDDAQQVDLDGDGKTDLLVEDLATFIPGEPVEFHMKLVNRQSRVELHFENHVEWQGAENAFTVERR